MQGPNAWVACRAAELGTSVERVAFPQPGLVVGIIAMMGEDGIMYFSVSGSTVRLFPLTHPVDTGRLRAQVRGGSVPADEGICVFSAHESDVVVCLESVLRGWTPLVVRCMPEAALPMRTIAARAGFLVRQKRRAARAEAVYMGLHPRLGKQSGLRALDGYLLGMIFDLS